MDTTATPIGIITLVIFSLLLLLICGRWLLGAIKSQESPQIDETIIYKNQLSELEKDKEVGSISEEDYNAARLEIGRRLALSKKDKKDIKSSALSNKLIFASVLLMGFGATAIYMFIGRPFLRDVPFSAQEKYLLSVNPETLKPNEIMAILQDRARKDPKDPAPHLLMGKILATDGKDEEAMRAFQAALRRDNKNADALAELSGVIYRLNGNKPSPQSDGAMAAALRADPNNLTAKFYFGQYMWDNGDKEKAIQIWEQAYNSYPKGDMKRAGLAARIAELASKLDVGPNMKGPKMGGPMMGGSMSGGPMSGSMGAGGPMMGGAAGGPMMAALAAGMNPQDFINSMIAQRQAKLEANPSDIGLRLSLARVMINQGKVADANKLIDDGMKLSANDEMKTQIFQIAKEVQSANAGGK